jgi:general secretion pathway protein E
MPPTYRLSPTGGLTQAALDRVQRLAEKTGERPEHVAVKLGLLAEPDLARAYAEALATPLVTAEDLAAVTTPALPEGFLRHSRLVPLPGADEALRVAMADPLDETAIAAMRFALERPIVPRAAIPAAIDATLDRLTDQAPVIRLVN